MSSESNINKLTFNQLSENKYSSLIPVEGEFYVTPDYINLPLLTSMWFDHIVNDISWLRSDTFAWQSGDVYTAVYNHLVSDISGKTAVSETVGGVTISYYLADDGHKITTDETSVENIYTATGVAWYYILDTTNHRFKLPRTKFGFTGLRDNVGNYVSPGLPNIKGDLTRFQSYNIAQYMQAPFYTHDQDQINAPCVTTSDSAGWAYRIGIDASLVNSIYGSSTTVQPPATQMYLYFYVGNFTNSAIEQTAGITTATLNNKMDNDLGNSGPISDTFKTRLNTAGIRYVKETYSSGNNWYRVWSDGWIEQGGYRVSEAKASAIHTFIKPFTTTNYQMHAINEQITDAGINVYAFQPLSTTQCYFVSAYNGTFYAEGMYWYACGY